MIDALDRAAEVAGMTRSAVLRDVVGLGLAARGFWPPRAGEEVSDARQ